MKFVSDGTLYVGEKAYAIKNMRVGCEPDFFHDRLKKRIDIEAYEIPDAFDKSLGRFPKIEMAIFDGPATIVFWDDGVKTVAKCHPRDKYSKKKGIKACILKRMFGNSFTNLESAIDAAMAAADTEKADPR